MFGQVGNLLGIGNAGGGFSNPADAAMPYFNQIPGTIKPYYDPYINAGKESLSSLMGQYNQLVSNPGQKFSDLGQGFQQSPGYQFQYNQGMNAANSAAAAGGMLGTPYHQQNASNMASQLANQDFYNYMGNVQNLYGQGIGGQSQINQMGYGASNELANSLANALMNQGNMAYAGVNNQNAANQAGNNNFGQMLGGAIGAAGQFFSDIRLKKDIYKVGEMHGHNIYRFRYIHDDSNQEYEGVIAQEVKAISPKAVEEKDGFLCVNYDAIGLEMKRV